jgi:hypothetical protein
MHPCIDCSLNFYRDIVRMDFPPIILPRTITYEWSRNLTKAAGRRYFSRRHRRPMIVFCIIGAVCIGGLVFDPRADMAGAYWVPLILCLALILLYVLAYYRITRTFEEVPDNRITVRVEPESITFETSEFVSTMKWSAIKRLWKFPDVLLICLHKNRKTGFTPLPVASLGAELCRLIEEKVREHGGQVS